MKAFLLIGALILTTASSARAYAPVPKPIKPSPVSVDMEKVAALANNLISGSDVRKTIEKYENTDGNLCAPAGVSYIVSVQLRRSRIEMDPKTGEPVQVRNWEDFNRYWISKADLDAGHELSDARCLE